MNDLLRGFVDGLLGGQNQMSLLQRLGGLFGRLTIALVMIALSLYLAARASATIARFFKRQHRDLGLGILLGRVAYFGILFVGFISVLGVFGVDATALFATLGVVGLAVSLALQDVLKNVFAGIYLLIERPFRPGETIQVRTFTGVVESVDLRTTTLRGNGDVIYVPNAIMLGEVLVNQGVAAAAEESSTE